MPAISSRYAASESAVTGLTSVLSSPPSSSSPPSPPSSASSARAAAARLVGPRLMPARRPSASSSSSSSRAPRSTPSSPPEPRFTPGPPTGGRPPSELSPPCGAAAAVGSVADAVVEASPPPRMWSIRRCTSRSTCQGHKPRMQHYTLGRTGTVLPRSNTHLLDGHVVRQRAGKALAQRPRDLRRILRARLTNAGSSRGQSEAPIHAIAAPWCAPQWAPKT